MTPLAHSSRPGRGLPVQEYADHIRRVMDLAGENADNLAGYSGRFGGRLAIAVRRAAEFHDLGKLDPTNQAVLASGSCKAPLPLNHADAGAAGLLRPDCYQLLAATLVFSHHKGLPDFVAQSNLGQGGMLRDPSLKTEVDAKLDEYLKVHNSCLGIKEPSGASEPNEYLSPLAIRFALSCLVDADHQDTAEHYGHVPTMEDTLLNPERRLGLLDHYVRGLTGERQDDRTRLRQRLYEACRMADVQPSMYACDAPVGSGKTTAVMAHLLSAAITKGLRRIIVVLPFTNIIDQSVAVYRNGLTADPENPESVVAAHHHRAEFDHPDSRHLTYLWKPPVVVTTAVQFFETLAAFRPAALRKLHQLPGSAVFIDESHAALPARLWPLAWRWLQELVEEWGCHIVLGSGSLNRFWELEEFSKPPVSLPELVGEYEKPLLSDYERLRIEYGSHAEAPMDLEGLSSVVNDAKGPRLLIVNTVQSAAVIASEMAGRVGRQGVEHLSTALCPRDREKTLRRVRQRLEDKSDTDWTLVATSCVEAGVDLSFRTGFREQCGLNSLIQTGGRINRNGEYGISEVWDFELRHIGLLKKHPGFKESALVLREMFAEDLVGPESATEAMRREIRLTTLEKKVEALLEHEQAGNFPKVSELFRVIESDTVTVVVDPDLKGRLESNQSVEPEELMRLSVQIYSYLKVDYALKEFDIARCLYAWTLAYDDFLGYMAGVLAINSSTEGAFFV